MTRKLVTALIIAGPVLVLAIGVTLMRGRPRSDTQPLAAAALRGANVLLITIDTLRADHVGAYGSAGALTPTFDAFAKDGLRFDHTYAHVPLTLPSHASLLTAAYPPRHRVHDNGTFRLDGGWPTVATALKAAGYRTGAFVGAFILDARFGLNRGFDVYDDRMLGSGSDLEVVQRNAEQVLAPAYDWIAGARPPASSPQPPATSAQPPAASPQPPWFAWIHLYDPHEPYTPPEPYRSQYAADPYDGEIAFADAALGAFTARLRSSGTLANTLVVVTSDHGESLGEHSERTHGLFAYDATLRVPLVFYVEPAAATPRPRPIRHGVFGDTMRIVDVVPTVLDLVGVPPLPQVDGRTVRPFISGERPFDDPGSYFEALNANLTRDWAPLTGLVREQLKLIDLPVPELYDLSVDPAEEHNRYARDRDRARDLEARLDRIAKTAPVLPSAIDADAEARLRSLGYAVASSSKPARTYTADDDPKRLVHLNAALDAAAATWARGETAQAIEILRTVIRERPTMTLAYDRLAFMLRATGRPDEAAVLLDGAARAGHADRALLRSLGVMLRDAGDLQRAASVLAPLARDDPGDLQTADALGQTYARMDRAREAETLFKRVLATSPNAAATWNNLGAAYLADGRIDAAIDALSRAVAINPALATAHNGLGVAYARRGEIDRAVAQWRRALEVQPGFPDALYNLERAETKKGLR